MRSAASHPKMAALLEVVLEHFRGAADSAAAATADGEAAQIFLEWQQPACQCLLLAQQSCSSCFFTMACKVSSNSMRQPLLGFSVAPGQPLVTSRMKLAFVRGWRDRFKVGWRSRPCGRNCPGLACAASGTAGAPAPTEAEHLVVLSSCARA